MSKFDQKILAVRSNLITATLKEALARGGFLPFTSQHSFKTIVDLATTGRRGDLEEDPASKQIIPYLVLGNTRGDFLYYTRATGTGESRLHHKLSLGVGGHIEIEDIASAEETVLAALKRETREEFGEDINISEPQPLGIIYREDTPVDMVHIGILFTAKIVSGVIHPNTEEIATAEFAPAQELNQLLSGGEYDPETWTKITWQYLQHYKI